MQLTDTGESRVNGYLFVLERSLTTFLPQDVVSVGYTLGVAFMVLAVMKPIFPDNVGLWVYNASGIPHDMGMRFPAPPDEHIVGGYWIIPIGLVLGLLSIVWTNRLLLRFLRRWRKRSRTELS